MKTTVNRIKIWVGAVAAMAVAATACTSEFESYNTDPNAAQVVDQVKEYFGDSVFGAVIPRNVRLAEAPSYGMPVNYYDRSSRGTKAYNDLAAELLKNHEK